MTFSFLVFIYNQLIISLIYLLISVDKGQRRFGENRERRSPVRQASARCLSQERDPRKSPQSRPTREVGRELLQGTTQFWSSSKVPSCLRDIVRDRGSRGLTGSPSGFF